MADEAQITGTGAQTSARRNADRRTPRFSWNHAYEGTFFRSLCESMQLGFRDSHNFKSGAWERAAIALRDKHGAYPEKSHLVNKADNARKKFRMWRGLREDPEFLYNPTTRMVTASEEAWARHFEKEPLSKALRGRPFDHEEYMEILFPDVIGSGGAPKRIMRPRRRNPDGTFPPKSSSTTNASTVNPNPEPSLDPSLSDVYGQNTPQNPLPQPTPSSSQRPISTSVATRTPVLPSPNALTPPDETRPGTELRKRPPQDPAPGNTERRRGRPSRFTPSLYGHASAINIPVSTSTNSSSIPNPSNLGHSSESSVIPPRLVENSIIVALAEALKSRNPPRWPEQAVEILFREFSDEDLDLQLKIAEKALTDDNKAMVFVKMTPVLRRHWVGRLRDVHMRNLGGGLGLGRVGEEAS
ncbi:Myb/SANT-like DNA-binding domain-containing protein [Poronia punctata]|nr:Myb/SANT-like DNA-binding domain-containing protein [Poronia punctata]